MIHETGVDFKDFEQWCYDLGMGFARMLMKKVLELQDEQLLKERDKGKYRAKDRRTASIKTLMGEVEIDRRLYRETGGDRGYVYLLDKQIGMDTIGRMSINLVRRIADMITEASYRATSEAISFSTGQQIGHMGVWNAVQAVGDMISEGDEANARLAKARPDAGGRVIHVQQEEFDGVWVNMQGKDRPAKGRKAEMKLAASYEGLAYTGNDKKGRPTYDMVNPMFMSGFESAEKFYEKKEGQLGSVYNLDEIRVRLANGDGGGWVQGVAMRGGENVHLQLDPFHVKREIMRSGLKKDEQAKISKLMDEQKIAEMLDHIGSLMEQSADPDAAKRVGKMLSYFENNSGFLVPVLSRGIKLPEPPEGTVYGNMGTMEGTVCNTVALRMKKRKASFTKKGAGNLARLIGLKRGGALDDTICGLSRMRLPILIEEAATAVISAAKTQAAAGKGYEYPARGGMPFAGAFTTNGRRAIKGMLKYRRLADLAFK